MLFVTDDVPQVPQTREIGRAGAQPRDAYRSAGAPYRDCGAMTTNGIHPFLAAQIARYRADDLVREANNSRRAKLARRRGRRTR